MPFAEHAEGRVVDRTADHLADAESQAWVERLHRPGPGYEETVSDLWSLLLRAAYREAHRRAAPLRIGGPELDDLAHQAANDALVAILAKLDDFRGESRFTTWAYKFVMFEVSTKLGRHFWRNRSGALDDADWERLPDRLALAPEQRVELRELVGALRRAVEEDLTERQRAVFIAIAVNGVPTDALTHQLGSNRNAIYKVLFDARQKLRASLASAGFPVGVTEDPR